METKRVEGKETKKMQGFDWKWLVAWIVPLVCTLFVTSFIPSLKFYVDNEISHHAGTLRAEIQHKNDMVKKDLELLDGRLGRRFNKRHREAEERIETALLDSERRLRVFTEENAKDQFTEENAESLRHLIDIKVDSLENELRRMHSSLTTLRESRVMGNSTGLARVEMRIGSLEGMLTDFRKTVFARVVNDEREN